MCVGRCPIDSLTTAAKQDLLRSVHRGRVLVVLALAHACLILHLLLLEHVLILKLLDLLSLLLGHLPVLHLHLRLLDRWLLLPSCANGLIGSKGRNLLLRQLVRWLAHLVWLSLQVHHVQLLR